MAALSLKDPYNRQLVLASLLGLALGVVVVAFSGQEFSPRPFALVAGSLFGFIVVLYTRDIKRLLVIVIIVDALSGFDFHLSCNKQFLLTSCGFGISLTALALVGLYALWIMERRSNPALKMPLPRLGVVGITAALFVGAGLLSLISAARSDFVLYELWDYIILFFMYVYLVNYIKDRQALSLVIYTILFAFSIQLVIMQLQGIGLIGSSSSSLTGYSQRITGTLYSPNVAGSLLSQMIVVLVAALGLQMAGWRKGLLMVLLALSVHSLIGTESRGAWVAAVVGIVIVGLGYAWKRWLNVKAVVGILLAAALVFALFSGSILNRLTQDDKGSAASRAPLEGIAYNMIRANPITGVGLNNFGVVFRSYIQPEQYGAWLYLVHNGWLLIWSEVGTAGFAVYLTFRLLLVWQCINLIRRGDHFMGVIGLGLMASMISSGVHMTGDVFNARTLIEFLWLQAAVVSAMRALLRQETKAKTPLTMSSTVILSENSIQPAYPFSATNRR